MRSVVRVLAAMAIVLVVSCGGDDPGPEDTGSTTTTTALASTTTATSSTTSTTATPTTRLPYGSACAPGSHPDCIDPDGDGRYEYLKDGAECMRTLGGGLCSDLDGDGVAGYPDSG
jgi:hypothetical protein